MVKVGQKTKSVRAARDLHVYMFQRIMQLANITLFCVSDGPAHSLTLLAPLFPLAHCLHTHASKRTCVNMFTWGIRDSSHA
jgi:hypothetical protein